MPIELCVLVQSALRDPASLVQFTPAQLDMVLRLLRRVRLLAYVAVRLDAVGLLAQLPDIAVDQLRSAAIATQARVQLATWELDRLVHALGEARPQPLIVLKGCAYLLAGLPNARGRSFADVDLLVSQESIAAVERRLMDSGWRSAELSAYDQRFYREWGHELPPLVHEERGVEVDLHHQILRTAARIKPDPSLLRQSARAVPGTAFHVLAPTDMVLHAMVHLFHGGEMVDALRELVDIHEMLEHYSTSEPGFWAAFWPRARELRLTRPAFYGLRYSRMLLGTAIPSEVLTASGRDGPALPLRVWMDSMVPQALFAPDPDRAVPLARRVALAVLHAQAHWNRMPPWRLMLHLSRKMLLRQRVQPAAAR